MVRIGTSVREFFARFPTESSCLQQIARCKLNDSFHCPYCGKPNGWTRVSKTKKYLHKCRNQYSVLEGTVFYRSNLSLMLWFYALLLTCNSSNGVRGSFLRKHLGLGTKTAFRVADAIRTHIAFCERPKMLGGPGKSVFVDEVYLKYLVNYPSKARFAGEVMGFACDGQVITGIIKNRSAPIIVGAINRYVRPGSRIVSDGHASYRGLKKLGWHHRIINHSRGFSDVYGLTTNDIERYWAYLRRRLRPYKQIDARFFWKYIAEAEFFYNRRHANISTFDELISLFPKIGNLELENMRRRFVW